jgi:hypothetical protein
LFPLTVIFQIGNLYVGHLCELLAQPQEPRGGQGNTGNPWLAAVPCPYLRSCGLADSSLTQDRKIEITTTNDCGNIKIAPRSMKVEIWNEAEQFHF